MKFSLLSVLSGAFCKRNLRALKELLMAARPHLRQFCNPRNFEMAIAVHIAVHIAVQLFQERTHMHESDEMI